MRPLGSKLLVAVVVLALPASTWAQFDTEIASFQGKLYATSSHGSWDKKTITVSESTDGIRWVRVATLDPAKAQQSSSYGNPRFSIGPNGQLMLSCKSYPHSLTVWETDNGRHWNLRQDLAVAKARPNIVSDYPLDSGLVWDQQQAFFLHCGSACGSGGLVYLFSRTDGDFKLHLPRRWMKPNNEEPDEGDYDDCDLLNVGSAIVCLTNSKTSARLGIANVPYQDWTWSKLVPDIQKPKLLQLPDDRILVTGVQGSTHSLFQLNLALKKLELLRTIPTRLSKPSRIGMTLHQGDLWVGYRVKSGNGYVQHAEKMSLDNLQPTIREASLSELAEQILAQPELKADNTPLAAAGQEQSGGFANEVLRRRESIVASLTRIELDNLDSRPVRDRLTALGPQTRELVAPILCRQLMSEDAFRRQRAKDALSILTDIPASAVPVLLQAAQNPAQSIRESALQVLCFVREVPESAESALRTRLTDHHDNSRAYAAACLLSLNKDDESAKRVIAGFLNNRHVWTSRNPDSSVSREDIRRLRTSPQEPVNTLLKHRADTIWPLVMDRLDDRNSSRDWKLIVLRDFQQYYSPYKSAIPRDRLCQFAVSPATQHDQQLLQAALQALRRLGNYDAAQLQTLSSGPPVVRRWLAEALGSATVNRENAVKMLRQISVVSNNIGTTHDTYLISATDFSTRDTAVESLARLNVAHQRLIARLTADFQSDDAANKNSAIHQAEKIAADAPELLPELIKLLEDDSVQKGFGWYRYYPCENVVGPLVAVGQPAVPALIEALESSDADARFFAAQALGRIGAKEATEPLVNLLYDDQSGLSYAGKIQEPDEIRVSALTALAQLGPETGPFVPQFLKFLDQESTREAAIKVIANSGPAGTLLIPKLKHLRAGELKKSERREIAFALACLSFDAPDSMQGMRELLMRIAQNPQSEEDRSLARDAMAFIQSQGERAAPLIAELSYLVDQHEHLNLEYRAYAAAALAHIDANNPRWRSLFDQWYADHFGRVPSRSSYWDMTQISKALKQL